MKHHFLSQVYLKGFVRRAGGAEHANKKVFVTDLRERTIEPVLPKDTAFLEDFYAVATEDGGKDHAVEQMWAAIEVRAAKHLRRLRRYGGEFDAEGLSWVLPMVAIHFGRVPHQRAMVRTARTQTRRIIADLLANDFGLFCAEYRRARPADPSTDAQLFSTWVELPSVTEDAIQLPPEAGLSETIHLVQVAGKIFCSMAWMCLETDATEGFLTSDRPVVPFSSSATNALGHGLGRQDIEVTFPISSRVCLRGVWEGVHLQRRKIEPAEVMAINRRTVSRATNACYAHSEALASWALSLRTAVGSEV